MRTRKMTSKTRNKMHLFLFYLAHAVAINISVMCTVSAFHFQNVNDALTSYAVYHRDPRNQFIHVMFVPFLLWSFLMGLAHLPILNMDIHIPYIPSHKATYATLWLIGLPLFYTIIDTFGGILFSPFMYCLYASAVKTHASDQAIGLSSPSSSSKLLPSWMGTGNLLQLGTIIQIVGWTAQIHVGHKYLEGNNPALHQSIGGSFISSPLFVFYEILWFLGTHKNLQDQTIAGVTILTQELCQSGAVMRVCENLASI